MSLWTLFGWIAVFEAGAMTLAWAVTLQPGRSGWIDAIWSFSIGGSCVAAALWPGAAHAPGRGWLLAALVGLWSGRLGGSIAWRTAGGGDDPRYAELRRRWGAAFAPRAWGLLMIQAACAWALAVAVRAAALNPAGFVAWSDVAGAAIALGGVAGETLADRQLQAFRRQPGHAGQVCERGLWSLSRHPNYFCEWLVWLGISVIAIGPAGASAFGWLGLIGPVLMYGLLVHVSGIPPLEAHMLRSRGAAFAETQARISAFWPRPARHAAARSRP